MFNSTDIALIRKSLIDGIGSLKKKGAYISSYNVYLKDEDRGTFLIAINIDFAVPITCRGIQYKTIEFDFFTPESIWVPTRWQDLDKLAKIPTGIDYIARGVVRLLWTIWANTGSIRFVMSPLTGEWLLREPYDRIKRTMEAQASAFEIKAINDTDNYVVLFR